MTFRVDRGDYVAIVGSSGSGKSTLLNLLGALDRPTSGEVRYDGRDVRDHERRRAGGAPQRVDRVRVPVVPPAAAADRPRQRPAPAGLPLVEPARSAAQRALDALEAVGLGDRVDHRPPELSGGQQQRVAIARALVTEPPLLLADEPTGNLDTVTGEDIMGLLERLHRDRGMAVVVITHEPEIAARADRRIELRDGQVLSDEVASHRRETAGPATGRPAPEAAS